MIKFFINTISKSLEFSKTESRGTLILILIIFVALIVSNYRIGILKNKNSEVVMGDSTYVAWIKQVDASYKQKKKLVFDKNAYRTTRKEYKKKTYSKPKKPSITKELPIEVLDLNVATAEDLQKVKGIGKVFSERIIKYRTLLGGFNDLKQLLEVYRLKQEVIDEIANRFLIKSSVTPIQINTDSFKILIKHPYITYDLAKIIMNYRKQHGDIASIEDLKKIKALDDTFLLKINPYIQ